MKKMPQLCKSVVENRTAKTEFSVFEF